MLRLRPVPRPDVTRRVFLLKILAVARARMALRRMMEPCMTATWSPREWPDWRKNSRE